MLQNLIFQNDQFVIDDLLYAMNLDSLTNSHPISIPVHNPNQINELFDRISYSKVNNISRVATARDKYLENEIFSRSGKSQGILWMAREI